MGSEMCIRDRYSPTTCICHATFAQRSGALARGEAGSQRPSATGRRRARRPPDKVDVFGEHDQRCKAAFPLARHNRIQVRVADELKNAGKFVRKASVRDLRRDRYDRSQSQADIVVVWHQYANLAFS